MVTFKTLAGKTILELDSENFGERTNVTIYDHCIDKVVYNCFFIDCPNVFKLGEMYNVKGKFMRLRKLSMYNKFNGFFLATLVFPHENSSVKTARVYFKGAKNLEVIEALGES